MRSRCCLCVSVYRPHIVARQLLGRNVVGLWDHVAVRVRVVYRPLSLLGNGSVNISLSLLGNESVKFFLSLLGNGSVETL
jgi:hypothetical protein